MNFSRIGRRISERWAEFRGYTPVDRNLFYMCVEIFPAGIAMGMVAFNPPFVLRLGGSDSLIGWMTSLPALMAILFSMPAANFMERRSNRRPAMISNISLARVVFLLIALVPWVLPAGWQPFAIVGLVSIQAIFVAFFNAGWLSLLADVCPPDRRSTFFSMRWLLLAITWGASSFLSGLWLDQVPFPLNYQALNFAGFLCSEFSSYIVSRATFPVYAVRQNVETARSSIKPRIDLRGFRQFVKANLGFVNVNIAVLITFLGVWGAGPLLTLYFVKTLHVRDSWLGINTLMGQLGTMAGAILANRYIKLKSNSWVMRRALILFWVYPLIIVLIPIPEVIWIFSFIFLTLDPIMNVTLLSMLYELIPEDRRSSWMSGHVTLMNIGAMFAPLITVEIAHLISINAALIVCALFRLIGVALFWLLPVLSHKNQPSVPASDQPV